MTKREMIMIISETAGISKEKADKAWRVMWGIIQREPETLTPVGKFKHVVRAARKGRNPSTGEEIDIPEKIALAFKASR